MTNCTPSTLVYTILQLINLLATFSINMIGSNLLCHRYLHEKASIMTKM